MEIRGREEQKRREKGLRCKYEKGKNGMQHWGGKNGRTGV